LNLFRKSSLEPEIGFGLVYFEEVVSIFSTDSLNSRKKLPTIVENIRLRNASEHGTVEKSATIGLSSKSFF